jgi:hypothetical protein
VFEVQPIQGGHLEVEHVVLEDGGHVVARSPAEHGDEPWTGPTERGLCQSDGVPSVDQPPTVLSGRWVPVRGGKVLGETDELECAGHDVGKWVAPELGGRETGDRERL